MPTPPTIPSGRRGPPAPGDRPDDLASRLDHGVDADPGPGRPLLGQEPSKPTSPASATNPAVPAVGHSIHGEAFDDGPRHQARLIPGMGKVDFPVTTGKPEASRRSPRRGWPSSTPSTTSKPNARSARRPWVDPACPMAYWGMAMANVNNAKRAKGFLKEAKARASAAKTHPPRSSSTSTPSTPSTRKAATTSRIRRSTCSAWRRSSPSSQRPRSPGLDGDGRLAGSPARHQPSGPRRDPGVGPRQGAPSTPAPTTTGSTSGTTTSPPGPRRPRRSTPESAPGIAHAWHMPGHTYTELKRYADAAYQQEGSARVDHASMIRDRVMPFEIHNYAHNNQWLATSLVPRRPGPGRHHRRPQPRRTAARPPEERPQRRRLRPAIGPAPMGRGPGPLRTLGRPDRRHRTPATSTGTDNEPEKVEKAYALGLAYAAKSDQAKLADQIAAPQDGRRAAQGHPSRPPAERRSRPRPRSRLPPPSDSGPPPPPAPDHAPPSAVARSPSSKATRSWRRARPYPRSSPSPRPPG